MYQHSDIIDKIMSLTETVNWEAHKLFPKEEW